MKGYALGDWFVFRVGDGSGLGLLVWVFWSGSSGLGLLVWAIGAGQTGLGRGIL